MNDIKDFDIVDGVLTKYRGKDSEVVVPEGVTFIGDNAFFECDGVESIVLPEGITQIGYRAFSGCLCRSITLPHSIKCIGEEAFYMCEYLDKIDIPDSIESIGDKAFSYCRYLTSINCFKTLNSNKNYKSIDGNLYTKDGKTLVSYAVGKLKHEFVVPQSVKNIGSFAFHGCEEIYEIHMPQGVQIIGEGAFAECVNLHTIELPKSISSIGKDAFFYCVSMIDFQLDEKNKYFQLINGDLYKNDGSLVAKCESKNDNI